MGENIKTRRCSPIRRDSKLQMSESEKRLKYKDVRPSGRLHDHDLPVNVTQKQKNKHVVNTNG